MSETKTFEAHSKEIFENFDWERVHKAMIATNWVWSFGKDNYGIPDVNTIKKHAYTYLKEAFEKQSQVSTGGFTAKYEDGNLSLAFTLEEWESN
jgi:hypothetical protein